MDLDVVMEILKQEMDDDAVITYGAGNHSLWPARYLQHNTANSLAAPRNGAMGMGIPAAVAASLAYPGRQVISVAGDGCFLMNGQEIATAMGHGGAFHRPGGGQRHLRHHPRTPGSTTTRAGPPART